jgi:two-component system, LuxR family, sensor kinase FixL
MDWVTVAWSMAVAACLALALVHLSIWIRHFRDLSYLHFALMSLAAGSVAGFGLAMVRAQTNNQFAVAVQWMHVPIWMLVISLTWLAMISTIEISRRKRADLEFLEQKNELAHLSRVTTLGKLSGSLAHELNQPLTAILSNAQAAQRILSAEGVDLDEVREILKDIVADDKRAVEVIRRLGALLKKGEVQKSALDVNEVVGDVLRLANHDLAVRSVIVHTELQPGLPPIIGDHVQLQQVLLNLIMNGCDAMTREAAYDRTLSVRTELADRRDVRVCVKDHGCGIPPNRIESIFDPFYSTKQQGMGLGLTVCRTIIVAHGGRLWASNNPDRGASFQFTLPAMTRKGTL